MPLPQTKSFKLSPHKQIKRGNKILKGKNETIQKWNVIDVINMGTQHINVLIDSSNTNPLLKQTILSDIIKMMLSILFSLLKHLTEQIHG